MRQQRGFVGLRDAAVTAPPIDGSLRDTRIFAQVLPDSVGYVARRLPDIDDLFVFVGEFVNTGFGVAPTLGRQRVESSPAG